MFRESGGAFGVREAAMEEQYFRRLVHFAFITYNTSAKRNISYGSSVVFLLHTWTLLFHQFSLWFLAVE